MSDSDDRAKGSGIRTSTANRLGSDVVPVIMGAAVELADLKATFFVTGGAALVLVGSRGMLRPHIRHGIEIQGAPVRLVENGL